MKSKEEIVDYLREGNIADWLHLVHWVDITEHEDVNMKKDLGHFEFMTPGYIISFEDDWIVLAKEWNIGEMDKSEEPEDSDCILRIPYGVIRAIYYFYLGGKLNARHQCKANKRKTSRK